MPARANIEVLEKIFCLLVGAVGGARRSCWAVDEGVDVEGHLDVFWN